MINSYQRSSPHCRKKRTHLFRPEIVLLPSKPERIEPGEENGTLAFVHGAETLRRPAVENL